MFLLLGFILLLMVGFFAVRWGLTNVAGEENPDSYEYNLEAKKDNLLDESLLQAGKQAKLPDSVSIYGPHDKNNRCKLSVAARYNDYVASEILKAYVDSRSEVLLDRMLLAMKLRLTERQGFSDELSVCESRAGNPPTLNELSALLARPKMANLYTWQDGEPWKIIKEAVVKDQKTINEAALKAGIQPRLLLSVAIVEQLRLYYTQRELFEKVFKPLKILANANKMAWGVMSIKESMAIQTENYLKDKNAAFYPGDNYQNLLDFPAGVDKNKERYRRLTNEADHFYSYLYGALIVKEIQSQWAKAGFEIEYRPEVVATLFNIGFEHSEPKENPTVGGSTISIGKDKYYFGSLAYEFYYSGEMSKEFPFEQ